MKSIFSDYYKKDLDSFFTTVCPSNSKAITIKSMEDIKRAKGKYDYVLLPNTVAYISDVQDLASKLKRLCHQDSRVVVVYYNFMWKPLLDLASFLGLRKADVSEPNWLSHEDISVFFNLEGCDEIRRGRRFLFPVHVSFFSNFVNRYISPLPLINSFCLTTYQVFRPIPKKKDYSVSIIIPARNEAGHMKGVLRKLPRLGKKMEVIFVEGGSTDNTWDVLKSEVKNRPKGVGASLYKQRGKGKGDAVRLGFSKAKNDMLMILDADLTVNPKDLKKFYSALSEGHADFINGSRLVYPMEDQAMRTLNYLGNKMFGWTFSFLLGQNIKDTLCGTKVLLNSNYRLIAKNRKHFGDFDPFGDFDLLFGASRLNLKIIDLPVRYRERVYGETNISRFSHGLLLIRMTLIAAKKIKFA